MTYITSFSLASARRVQHDNESWHARQRAYLTNIYNLNSYASRTRACADVLQRARASKNVKNLSQPADVLKFREKQAAFFEANVLITD